MFETIFEKISAMFSVVVGFLVGGWSNGLSILIAFMVLDYITGLAKAIRTNSLNSTVSRWGIFTKFLMFIPLILSNLLDSLLALNGTALTICTIFYICSEGLSICENLASAGVPLPKQLVDLLEKVSNENNDKTLPR